MSSDVARDQHSNSPNTELSTISDVSNLSSTDKIMHGTYMFPRQHVFPFTYLQLSHDAIEKTILSI